jgi:hypothetical protein|tara:strand:+ start:550 stop:732 length:183 start_codon:yes stop_codon:yes gene_type:complete
MRFCLVWEKEKSEKISAAVTKNQGIKNEEHDGFVFFVSSSSRATNISSRNNSEAKTNREE